VERFVALNDCTGEVETVVQRFDSTCVRRTACANDSTVQLCTIIGGGHTWPSGGLPSGIPPLIVGSESQTLPISEMLWEFLARHRLPN
jgi:polyhydroxybutyrate depolymerase